MIRIAYLTYNWDFDLCSAYCSGMERYLRERKDVDVWTFNAFGKYGEWTPDAGNFEIFNLPDFSSYDGFIIQGNRSWPQEMRQEIVDQLYRLHKPCISMNYHLNHAFFVGTDNERTEYEFVRELLQRHTVHSIAFVRGYARSLEAQERERGFMRAVQEAGLQDVRMYDGSWNEEDGRAAAEKMLSEGKPADLIVCANDDLALAVQKVMQDHGFLVPEDTMICGFDNSAKACGAEPRITSVDRDYAETAYRSIHRLVDIIEGKDERKDFSSPWRIAYGKSTGDLDSMVEMQLLKRKFIDIHDELSGFYQINDRTMPALSYADGMPSLFRGIENMMPVLECHDCWLAVDHRYFEDMANVDALMHYSQTIDLCAWQNHGNRKCTDSRFHIYENFSRNQILPDECRQEGGHLYEVYALRYTHTIGYFVTDGVSHLTRYNLMELSLHTMENAIESQRREILLKKQGEHFGSLYVKDQLTGLYNRFGLQSFGGMLYRQLLRNNGEAWICFVDIDDMKHINDTYGHDAGDQAIRDTAMILKKAVPARNTFFMRYGGDEFVLISDHPCSGPVEEELRNYRKREKRVFHLSLSAGDYRAESDMKMMVERCIRLADENMYRIKRGHKEARKSA